MKNVNKKTKKNTRKILIIIGIVILLLVGAGLSYVYAFKGSLFGWQPTKQASTSTTTEPSKTTSTTPAQQETTSTKGESTNNSVKNNTPDTTPSSNTLDVSFTHWSTTSVGILISGVVSGTCTLTLQKQGETTITMTADTFQSGSSSSTCRGFNYDELQGGGWTATVTVTAGNVTGSASKTIE